MSSGAIGQLALGGNPVCRHGHGGIPMDSYWGAQPSRAWPCAHGRGAHQRPVQRPDTPPTTAKPSRDVGFRACAPPPCLATIGRHG